MHLGVVEIVRAKAVLGAAKMTKQQGTAAFEKAIPTA